MSNCNASGVFIRFSVSKVFRHNDISTWGHNQGDEIPWLLV